MNTKSTSKSFQKFDNPSERSWGAVINEWQHENMVIWVMMGGFASVSIFFCYGH